MPLQVRVCGFFCNELTSNGEKSEKISWIFHVLRAIEAAGRQRSFERRFDLKCVFFLPLISEENPFFHSFWGREKSVVKKGHYLKLAIWCGHHRKFLSIENRRDVLTQFLFFWIGQLVLGLASGLEAFSREPPCDSIGALAVRQTPETSGTAWEFLSYYPRLPSRCLRDPLCYLVGSKM